MNKNFLIGLGLLGAAGYFAWQNYSDGETTAAGGGADETAATTPDTNGGTSPALAPLLAEVKRLTAGRGDFLTFDEWNWYRESVTGTPGPAIEDARPGSPREERISIEQWWASVAPLVGGGA